MYMYTGMQRGEGKSLERELFKRRKKKLNVRPSDAQVKTVHAIFTSTVPPVQYVTLTISYLTVTDGLSSC